MIGGGITGAGILLDAASRGMKAALIEKKDFAWGTSSRSTKLIHGGLRYLKQMEVGLVREVGRERAIVHNNARHIVRPETMLLPMYKDGSLNKLSGGVGLWLYDFLTNVSQDERRVMLSRNEVIELEPAIRKEGLVGGALYYEYRTDDARLTIENLKTATNLGALALNYVEGQEFRYAEGRVNGLQCVDKIDGKTFDVSAHSIINATGPWSDRIMSKDGATPSKKLFLTNGLHIVVSAERLPINHSMYFDVAGDKRMVFAILRDDHVYIGTTDIAFDGDPDNPEPTEGETQYLLDATNHRFPNSNLTKDDIVSTWSGLRPLIYQEGKSASELSRKDEIFISDSGLISIAGGKLTGYRKMAERVVDRSVLLNGDDFGTSKSESILLSGGQYASEAEMEKGFDEAITIGEELGVDWRDVRTLFSRYGSNTILIFEALRDSTVDGDIETRILEAEVKYCVEHEMVHFAEDFGFRRTSMQHFQSAKWKQLKPDIEHHLEQLHKRIDQD